MGEDYQEGNNKKKRLRDYEINQIVNTFLNKEKVDDLSSVVTYDEIIDKNYSLAAGQYFDIKLEFIEISEEEYNAKIEQFENSLKKYCEENEILKNNILKSLGEIKYDKINRI